MNVTFENLVQTSVTYVISLPIEEFIIAQTKFVGGKTLVERLMDNFSSKGLGFGLDFGFDGAGDTGQLTINVKKEYDTVDNLKMVIDILNEFL